MSKKIIVTDAELPIMKVLWEIGPSTSPQIFDNMLNPESKNVSTLKTLLKRLVDKKAVNIEEINSRNYLYSPIISQEDYITQTRKSFLKRAFDGSVQKMLLNFITEEKITEDDLQKLIDIIKEEKDDKRSK